MGGNTSKHEWQLSLEGVGKGWLLIFTSQVYVFLVVCNKHVSFVKIYTLQCTFCKVRKKTINVIENEKSERKKNCIPLDDHYLDIHELFRK